AWLERLFDPTTAIGVLSREWLGIDSAGDHFGRRLLGETGAALLSTRGTLIHRDDRPQLEFVAARRFLDPVWDPHVFDSLLAIGAQAGESPGGSPVLLARGMTAPRSQSIQIGLLEAAHRARPDDPVWVVRLALARFGAGDTSYADSVLPAVVARGRAPEALAFAGWLAGRHGNVAGSRALLTQALSRGSDTGQAAGGRARAGRALPAWRDALSAGLLAQHRFDFACRGDHVVHVPRQRTGLLGGASEIVERHGHSRGSEPQQVEPDVLHRQHARLQLVRDELPPREEIRERLALALQQTHLSIPFRAVPLM